MPPEADAASPTRFGDVSRGMAPSPHDALFRAIFGLPQHAAAELEAVLPRELAERLDLARLTRVEGTFIDEALRANGGCRRSCRW